jgi:glyoxylase-like metal-dependent hydrolase (beta-lactamase superfamily II)
MLPSWGIENLNKKPFKPFRVDMVLRPDQCIEIGKDDYVQALYTPGHTWDFISYWIPSKHILIASEAVGCEDMTGHIFTEFLVDYDAYRKSMNRMAELDFEILCLGHKLVLTGLDAKVHIQKSLEQAAKYADLVERFLTEEGGDIKKTVARVKAVEWDPLPWPKQPENAYLLNTQARVKTLWQRHQQKKTDHQKSDF